MLVADRLTLPPKTTEDHHPYQKLSKTVKTVKDGQTRLKWVKNGQYNKQKWLKMVNNG